MIKNHELLEINLQLFDEKNFPWTEVQSQCHQALFRNVLFLIPILLAYVECMSFFKLYTSELYLILDLDFLNVVVEVIEINPQTVK